MRTQAYLVERYLFYLQKGSFSNNVTECYLSISKKAAILTMRQNTSLEFVRSTATDSRTINQ